MGQNISDDKFYDKNGKSNFCESYSSTRLYICIRINFLMKGAKNSKDWRDQTSKNFLNFAEVRNEREQILFLSFCSIFLNHYIKNMP